MKRNLTIFLVWITVATFTVELEINRDDMKTIKGKFCGSHLADMLSLVCDGLYNSDRHKKNMFLSKLRGYDDYEDIPPMEYLDDHPLSFPFRSREKAKSIIPEFGKRIPEKSDSRNGQQVQRGVVDECCHQACSLFEMTGYCANQ